MNNKKTLLTNALEPEDSSFLEASAQNGQSWDVKQFSSDKILKHLDNVQQWVRGGNPPPVTMELDMTNVCNHRCPECIVDYFLTTDNNSLPKETAMRIVEELAEAGVKGLMFTGGGEPLCHPNTPEIVELAKNLDMDVGFITNGELFSEYSAEKILLNSLWIRVSLDAGSPEVFQKTHYKSEISFNNIIEKLKLLVRIKHERQADCTIGVGFLTSHESRKDIERATLLCKEIGVDYIQFRPMQIHHGGSFEYNWEDVRYDIEECLKHATDNFHVLFSKHKYDMMERQDFGRDYGKCYGHQFASVVSANGKMYLCCHLRGYEKYCLGDLKKNSFLEIWNSNQRKKAVENINFKDCIPLCRCNTFNQILWNISNPQNHINFL